MKLLTKITTLVFVALTAGFVQVQAKVSDSGPFYFEGGIVHPGSTLTLTLNQKQLPNEARFNISCNIYNQNYKKQFPVVMQFGAFAYKRGEQMGTPTLNDKPLYLSRWQGLLNHEISEYKVSGVSLSSCQLQSCIFIMDFTNYDTTDSVMVEDCMATSLCASDSETKTC